jgi:hypothetical protein
VIGDVGDTNQKEKFIGRANKRNGREMEIVWGRIANDILKEVLKQILRKGLRSWNWIRNKFGRSRKLSRVKIKWGKGTRRRNQMRKRRKNNRIYNERKRAGRKMWRDWLWSWQ